MINTITDFFYYSFYYREYLIQSVARDLRKKYKRSALGYLWSMLNPLFMMIILTVVFSNIMMSHVSNYSVFLFAAMLPWTYFDGTTSSSLDVIRSNSQIFNQVRIPKFIFIVSIAMSNLVTLLLSIVPLLLVMWYTNQPILKTFLFMPLVIIPLVFFSIGVSSIIAVANVFFEDTQHLYGVILRALYFLCPILYSREMIPEYLLNYTKYNPLFGIMETMRGIVYYGTLPAPHIYFAGLLSSFAIMIIGLWIFKKADNKFLYFI